MSLTRTAELKAALSSASQSVADAAANVVDVPHTNAWNYLALALAIALILFRYYRNNTIKLHRMWFGLNNPGKQYPEHKNQPQTDDAGKDITGIPLIGNQDASNGPMLNENFMSGMALFTTATSKSTKGVPFIAIIVVIFVVAMVAMPQIKSKFLKSEGTLSSPAVQTPATGVSDAKK